MTAPAPAVFADLAGQEAAVAQLRRAAAEDRPTHAWMFTGPPGSGRSTAARAARTRASAALTALSDSVIFAETRPPANICQRARTPTVAASER